ncbi:S24 family peptidase [Adlercreutzia sp. JBNU-10]|uniref:S24 family peptidase n=1 Tax=Adlercreutzia faecimuris TaxID=2897341 RepID=A0ABS9WF28_9ACTN|nr:S24 family peptidase [Adlercreutzia sp. JBNU-10]
MDKVYPEGCLILVDPDQEPRNGSIAAVSIDGANYVMRRLLKTPSTIVLAPESFNPEHEDIVITAASGKTVELAGTVVWYQPAKELA